MKPFPCLKNINTEVMHFHAYCATFANELLKLKQSCVILLAVRNNSLKCEKIKVMIAEPRELQHWTAFWCGDSALYVKSITNSCLLFTYREEKARLYVIESSLFIKQRRIDMCIII